MPSVVIFPFFALITLTFFPFFYKVQLSVNSVPNRKLPRKLDYQSILSKEPSAFSMCITLKFIQAYLSVLYLDLEEYTKT